MTTTIIEILLIFLVWQMVLASTWYYTEVSEKQIPWLQFKPFICRKCLYTWSHLIINIVIYLLSNWEIYLIGSIIINILTSIALYVDEYNRMKMN